MVHDERRVSLKSRRDFWIGQITTAQAPAHQTTTIVSSVNPSIVGQAITFTASVAGNFPTGTVQFMDGGINLGSPVTLSGGGIAQLITSTLTQGTHPITAVYSGDANNAGSTSSTLSQVVNASGGGASINVALAANGGVASASSTSFGYSPSAVNNGDRSGNGGLWRDGTLQSFPDWVEIDFNGAKTIDHVIVYSAQDSSTSPVDPSDTLTFTQRGITAFEVQSWNGSDLGEPGLGERQQPGQAQRGLPRHHHQQDPRADQRRQQRPLLHGRRDRGLDSLSIEREASREDPQGID